MVEWQPQLIPDPDATVEQRDAFMRFECSAVDLTETQLLGAMDIVEETPRVVDNVIMLTSQAGKVGVMLAAWRDILDTGALTAYTFDKQTQAFVDTDPRVVRYRRRLVTPTTRTIERPGTDRTSPEEARKQIARLSFVIYAGQLALSTDTERVLSVTQVQTGLARTGTDDS